MLTAAADFEDRLRSFVGLSTEVIEASVWKAVLSLLAVLLELERLLSLLCRPLVC